MTSLTFSIDEETKNQIMVKLGERAKSKGRSNRSYEAKLIFCEALGIDIPKREWKPNNCAGNY